MYSKMSTIPTAIGMPDHVSHAYDRVFLIVYLYVHLVRWIRAKVNVFIKYEYSGWLRRGQ